MDDYFIQDHLETVKKSKKGSRCKNTWKTIFNSKVL